MLAALPIIQALIALAGEIPSLVQAGQTVIKLIQEGRDPTPAEQAQFDQALADAAAAIPQA
jgi:hypothetical protein